MRQIQRGTFAILASTETFVITIGDLAARIDHIDTVVRLVAAGQSTLSLYVAHIIIGEMGLKSLKFFNIDACLFPLWGGLLFFSTALLAASFWKKHFQKGPLEWMMRRLLEVRIPRLPNPFINGRITHTGR